MVWGNFMMPIQDKLLSSWKRGQPVTSEFDIRVTVDFEAKNKSQY
jgi:hypothetical protein